MPLQIHLNADLSANMIYAILFAFFVFVLASSNIKITPSKTRFSFGLRRLDIYHLFKIKLQKTEEQNLLPEIIQFPRHNADLCREIRSLCPNEAHTRLLASVLQKHWNKDSQLKEVRRKWMNQAPPGLSRTHRDAYWYVLEKEWRKQVEEDMHWSKVWGDEGLGFV